MDCAYQKHVKLPRSHSYYEYHLYIKGTKAYIEVKAVGGLLEQRLLLLLLEALFLHFPGILAFRSLVVMFQRPAPSTFATHLQMPLLHTSRFRSLPAYRSITINSCHSPTGVGVLRTSGESCYHRCRVPTWWSMEVSYFLIRRDYCLAQGNNAGGSVKTLAESNAFSYLNVLFIHNLFV